MDAASGESAPIEIIPHYGAAPMRQIVFDWETFGLDRGWGVALVVSWIIHGGADGPSRGTLKLRDYPSWKSGNRSCDRDIVADFLKVYGDCHIAFAHNGDRFDVKLMRTIALKYQLPMPRIKLQDPCKLAWNKYLLGRNSLEAVADFLGLEQSKIHVSPDTWRKALMDDDGPSWDTLVTRCESDVSILNEIASRVSGDVGMLDYWGSAR